MIVSGLILTGFLYLTLWYWVKIPQSRRYMRRPHETSATDPINNIIVLVPVYREASVVAQSIGYFAKLAAKLNVTVIFVTTERRE